MEHSGVKARQKAGTLERVVKYDAEALSAAWDHLASGDNDGYFFFFSSVPLNKGRTTPFWGADRYCFGRWRMQETAQNAKMI